MPPYDFHAFLGSIEDLQWHEMIISATQECDRVERLSYSVKGAVKAREAGSVAYAASLKNLLFFLRTNVRPGGASDREFASYRPLVEKLVAKENLKLEALDAFKLR